MSNILTTVVQGKQIKKSDIVRMRNALTERQYFQYTGGTMQPAIDTDAGAELLTLSPELINVYLNGSFKRVYTIAEASKYHTPYFDVATQTTKYREVIGTLANGVWYALSSGMELINGTWVDVPQVRYLTTEVTGQTSSTASKFALSIDSVSIIENAINNNLVSIPQLEENSLSIKASYYNNITQILDLLGSPKYHFLIAPRYKQIFPQFFFPSNDCIGGVFYSAYETIVDYIKLNPNCIEFITPADTVAPVMVNIWVSPILKYS